MIAGIYKISNEENGKLYIGSAVDLHTRFSSHRVKLRKNVHPNPKLQNAWNKYGESKFRFSIIEQVSHASALLGREQFWLDRTSAVQDGYNICVVAGNTLGRRMSESAKRKMSLAKIGKIPSPQDLENLRKGRKPGGWNRGLSPSEETRAKMSASNKGRQTTLGHRLTLDHREKISQGLRRFNLEKKAL